MTIIKPGELVDSLECDCRVCGAKFTYTRADLKTTWGHASAGIRCPTCRDSISIGWDEVTRLKRTPKRPAFWRRLLFGVQR